MGEVLNPLLPPNFRRDAKWEVRGFLTREGSRPNWLPGCIAQGSVRGCAACVAILRVAARVIRTAVRLHEFCNCIVVEIAIYFA